MTTRSHIVALVLATAVTAAVVAGIGQLVDPGASGQLFAQALLALASGLA